MFKEFDTNPQFDMFSSPAGMSRGSSLNIYLKDDLWHNIFREHIVARVNEDIFKVLYSSDKGSPNVPACVLVGMMILKEGQGWSDEQLFEQCRYKRGLSEAEFALIDHIMNEPGSKFIHRGNKREVDARFVALGKLMSRFIKLFKKHDYDQHQTLRTVFEQQFTVTLGRKVLPLEKEKVSARSIQSSHDTDANYRDKVGNKVKGYLVNPTETCDDPESDDPGEQVLNLITDINLDVVFTPDSEFIEPSLEESRGILEEKIEKVYADGAYNSTGNQAFARGNDMGLILSDIQGKPLRYELSMDEESPDELIVYDTRTRMFIEAYVAATRAIDEQSGEPEKKWRVKMRDGKYHYFTIESARTFKLRQKLRDVPIKEKWKCNNVKVSMFQLGSPAITARHATARLPPTGCGLIPGDVDKLQEDTGTRDANR